MHGLLTHGPHAYHPTGAGLWTTARDLGELGLTCRCAFQGWAAGQAHRTGRTGVKRACLSDGDVVDGDVRSQRADRPPVYFNDARFWSPVC